MVEKTEAKEGKKKRCKRQVKKLESSISNHVQKAIKGIQK